jgi:XTP/dITP diphosphohydrolase
LKKNAITMQIPPIMQRLIVATRNPHKTSEIQQILGPGYAVSDLSSYPETEEVVESGQTFEANAVLKAVAVSRQHGGLVLADDSGLEVAALHGAPGVLSARYAGKNATDQENVAKLLAELRGLDPRRKDRSACFRCAVAVAEKGRVLKLFFGAVKGTILDAPRGAHGFGYDPVFVPEGRDQTFAEMRAEAKNRISHRAQALEQARAFLEARRSEERR